MASSEGTPPKEHAPEEHDIFTDDENHSDPEDHITSESNLGRLKNIRTAVAEIKVKFSHELFGAQPSELEQTRQCNIQARGDLQEQADTLRAIKESSELRAEESCIREVREMSLILPDDPTAGSSTDATGAPDTSNDEAIAHVLYQVESASPPHTERARAGIGKHPIPQQLYLSNGWLRSLHWC